MTLRDRKIVEMFAGGATPDEVEDALGVPAAKALHRCKEILGAKDIFDEVEERKLVVTQYQALYQKGHALLDATGVKDWPKGVEALTKLLTALLEARKQEEYRSDREIEAMTRAQASILIRAVQLSYDRARELLAREYPQVDLLEIDAADQAQLVYRLQAKYNLNLEEMFRDTSIYHKLKWRDGKTIRFLRIWCGLFAYGAFDYGHFNAIFYQPIRESEEKFKDLLTTFWTRSHLAYPLVDKMWRAFICGVSTSEKCRRMKQFCDLRVPPQTLRFFNWLFDLPQQLPPQQQQQF